MEKKLWIYKFFIIITILIGSQLFIRGDIFATGDDDEIKNSAFCGAGYYVEGNLITTKNADGKIIDATASGSCVSVGEAPSWAVKYKDYLVQIANVVALVVKSLALLYIIYSGFMYMQIESDIKKVMTIKNNLISAFTAMFIAASAQMIITLLWGVVS